MIDPKYARYLTSIFETDFSKPLEGQTREETIQALLEEENDICFYGKGECRRELKERVDRGDTLGGKDITRLIAIAYNRVIREVGPTGLAPIQEKIIQEAVPFIHWEEISDKIQGNTILALVKIPKEERENVYRHARPLIAGLGGYIWGEILEVVSKVFEERRVDSRECPDLSKEEMHEMCTRLLLIDWYDNSYDKLVFLFRGMTDECYKDEREGFYEAARAYFSRMSYTNKFLYLTWFSDHYPHLLEGEVGKEAFEKLQKLVKKTLD